MTNFNKLTQAKLKCQKCYSPMMWDTERHLYVCLGCTNNEKVVTKKSLA